METVSEQDMRVILTTRLFRFLYRGPNPSKIQIS